MNESTFPECTCRVDSQSPSAVIHWLISAIRSISQQKGRIQCQDLVPVILVFALTRRLMAVCLLVLRRTNFSIKVTREALETITFAARPHGGDADVRDRTSHRAPGLETILPEGEKGRRLLPASRSATM